MTRPKNPKMRTLAAALAIALGGASGHAAIAQRGPHPDPFGDATVSRADAAARAADEFARLDVDHDGSLSQDELAAMFAGGPMAGMSQGMGAMMARMADSNGDGKLSRDEFVAAALHRFDRADTNHDGELTKAERDAEREARRAGMRARMGNESPQMDSPLGEPPMGRDDGVPMPPPPDDDGQ